MGGREGHCHKSKIDDGLGCFVGGTLGRLDALFSNAVCVCSRYRVDCEDIDDGGWSVFGKVVLVSRVVEAEVV